MTMTYTEAMYTSYSPYDNPYQGEDKRVVFVCSAGILRSATAARIYAGKYNTRSVGSEHYALIPLTHELLLWANEVVFVNEENYRTATQKFDLDSFKCTVKVLDIPDQYDYMHPNLIEAFEEQYEPVK